MPTKVYVGKKVYLGFSHTWPAELCVRWSTADAPTASLHIVSSELREPTVEKGKMLVNMV
jgi:hypothetical protein